MKANIELLLQVMHSLMSQGRIHDAGEVSAAISEISALRADPVGADVRAENERLRTLAEKVANAQAVYAYAEPNFGVLLSLKDQARAAVGANVGAGEDQAKAIA